MKIRRATPEDSAALCELMEHCPMGESLRLTFERRPDYFLGAQVQAEEPLVMLGEGSSGIFGVFSAGSRQVYLDGKPKSVRYLSDLRIDPRFRGKTWLARGYRYLRDHVFQPDEFAQTLILADNAEVMDLLTSGRAGLPNYVPHGEYLTHFLRSRSGRPQSETFITPANASHLPAMQDFFDREAPRRQFFPCYLFDRLTQDSYYRDQQLSGYLLAFKGDELAGMVGVWDQSRFRQTRIQEYRGALRWLRPVANLASPVRLPRPGFILPIRYLHSIVVQEDNPQIFRDLLIAGMDLALQEGFRGTFALGLDAADPLNSALSGFRKRTISGRHFLAGFEASVPPKSGLFYFDCARI